MFKGIVALVHSRVKCLVNYVKLMIIEHACIPGLYQLYVLFSLCISGLDEVTNKYLNDVKQSSLHSMIVKQTILTKTLRYPGQIEDVMNW